jgi:hypothetical protein
MYGGMYNNGVGNVHQTYNNIYGDGYPDSGATRPYAQPYPMAIIPRGEKSKKVASWLERFVKKFYG